MFGYIRPDLPYLYLKDDKLYKSLYCGVCKSIGKTCGTRARMTLTYDISFLSAVAHNIMGKDVEIKNGHCVLHPIVSRPIAARDDLTDQLAAVNIILAHYKVEDDIIDSGKGRLKRVVVKKGFRRAKKAYPKVDEIVKNSYAELRKLEKNHDSVIDRVSEPFAFMLQQLSSEIFGEFDTQATLKLFYFVGKWIYLIDALDDYDKDLKKKTYNPFVEAFKCESAKALLTTNGNEIATIFNDIMNNISEAYHGVKFHFNSDLIANVLLRGIPKKTDEIFKGIAK